MIVYGIYYIWLYYYIYYIVYCNNHCPLLPTFYVKNLGRTWVGGLSLIHMLPRGVEAQVALKAWALKVLELQEAQVALKGFYANLRSSRMSFQLFSISQLSHWDSAIMFEEQGIRLHLLYKQQPVFTKGIYPPVWPLVMTIPICPHVKPTPATSEPRVLFPAWRLLRVQELTI